MKHRGRIRKLQCGLRLVIAAAAAIAVAGCGSASDQAASLLHQTFSGDHRVSSGNLAVLLSVTPSRASGLKGPVRLALSGPFQSLGPGRIPASAFSVSLSAPGSNAEVTITSTGSSGYVTFRGQSYKLPPATFEQLESTFVRLSSVSGPAARGGAPGRLGIHPQRWLVNPSIVGNEVIDGTNTTRVQAGINVTALLNDLTTFVRRAAPAGARTPLPPTTRRQIADEVKHPVVNIWTGVTDKTLRQLKLDMSVPVSGRLSRLLGPSAAISLTMRYADLNQPQTITAPSKLQPYGQFQDKLQVLIQAFDSGLSEG